MLDKNTLKKCFLGITFGCFSVSCSDNTNNILDKQLITGESYFSVIYNKSFSERFKLSSQAVVKLDNGLQAVAIEIRRINYEYQCLLHFYVDDTVDIYMPGGGRYFSQKSESEYFFGKSGLNDEDQEWNYKVVDSNMTKMMFVGNSDTKDGWSKGLYYDRVHRTFLPDLNIASTQIFCHLLEKKHSPSKVRIQKSNIKNYLAANDDLVNPKHRENFVLLTIPEKLIENAAPYIDIAVKKVNEWLN
ncbi:hypothetical protein MNBD_GAMMA07-626 [hydrothermal vent metagenome]|uniref:Lipoprotein n=1 Tax=hydrothermal vent metagenome TaxID=652676 RepID=A0A3B0WZK9_9ZZZZ